MANLNTALTWDKKVFQGIVVTFKWNNAPSKPPHRESNRTRYTWDEVELIQFHIYEFLLVDCISPILPLSQY